MINRLFLMTTAVSLAMSGFATAQDAGSSDADAQPDAGVSSVLDGGEPVVDQGAGPNANGYVKSTHGDWEIQCLRVDEDNENCSMYQLLRDQSGGSVAEVSMFSIAGGGQFEAGAAFVVPLETQLTEKLTIQVDSSQAKRYEFSFCNPVGCYARVGFTSAEVDAFRRGNVANIRIVPARAPDQEAIVQMSLSGFTAAFKEMVELAQ